MKLFVLSLSMLLVFSILSVPQSAAQDIGANFVVEPNGVAEHEALVLDCLHHFSADGIAGVVTVYRLEHQGHGGLDSAVIHAFAENYLNGFCEAENCNDVVVQAKVCGQLTGYALLPY